MPNEFPTYWNHLTLVLLASTYNRNINNLSDNMRLLEHSINCTALVTTHDNKTKPVSRITKNEILVLILLLAQLAYHEPR